MLVVLLPASWWFGALLAASVHELAHYAAIRLTGGMVTGISITPFGAKMETQPMSRGKELICTAAGPMGSMILAACVSGYPETALCAAAQGLYNLLPVYPLDGGRILKCLLPEAAYAAARNTFLVMLAGLSLWWAVRLNLGFYPFVPLVIGVLGLTERNIPCKEPLPAVQ